MTDTMGHFIKAVDLMGESKFSEAEQVLSEGMHLDPDNLDLYEALARLYDRTDQNEKGLAVCQQWMAKDAHNNMALSNLSVFYQKLGRIDDAELAKAQATTLFMKNMVAEAKRQKNG